MDDDRLAQVEFPVNALDSLHCGSTSSQLVGGDKLVRHSQWPPRASPQVVMTLARPIL